MYCIVGALTSSGGTPAGPRKPLIGHRILSFPGSEVISGTIIASAIPKLFLHLVVKKLTLDKSQERPLHSL